MIPMTNSRHPGKTARFECIQADGLTVTQAARRLGDSRLPLSRVLQGRTAVSADMALAFERERWSNTVFWMRRQVAYDLAQARLRAVAA